VGIEILDCAVVEPLLGLGLPPENAICSDPFVELMFWLLLTKRNEEDVIPRPFGHFNNAL
jgi:hypothetical protein